METVEVVIKIPKDIYEALKADIYPIPDPSRIAVVFKVLLQKGTVLPKGHGRLIDADAINIHDVSPAYGMEVYGVTQDDIEYEPTIIAADKEEEE